MDSFFSTVLFRGFVVSLFQPMEISLPFRLPLLLLLLLLSIVPFRRWVSTRPIAKLSSFSGINVVRAVLRIPSTTNQDTRTRHETG